MISTPAGVFFIPVCGKTPFFGVGAEPKKWFFAPAYICTHMEKGVFEGTLENSVFLSEFGFFVPPRSAPKKVQPNFKTIIAADTTVNNVLFIVRENFDMPKSPQWSCYTLIVLFVSDEKNE